MFALFLLTTQALTFTLAILGDEPIVELPNGKIRGYKLPSVSGKQFYSFQKIPYASPPIADLRFKYPVPPKNWDGVLDAKELDVKCYQSSLDFVAKISEDCLYINVYTPKLPDGKDNITLLPVMLFIHGGGFTIGSSLKSEVGPEFIIDYDVILVTLNYRLGIFGFLSTGDEVIPGNNGLRDQQLGIKWAHDNIHLFGGDSEKIVVFGQSAGSASVTYQLLNKNSEGLFRGVICESGTFLSPWSFQRNPREVAFSVASRLNETFKTVNDSEVLLQYMQDVSAEDLYSAVAGFSSENEGPQYFQISQGYFFSPVLETDHEDAFLTRNMYQQLLDGDLVKVPTLIGINSEENLFDPNVQIPFLLWNILEQYDQNLDWVVPNDMKIEGVEASKEMGKLIKEIYTAGQPFIENLGTGVRFFSDNSFTRSVIKFSELYSKLAEVYFYQFSYDGQIGGYLAIYNDADKVAHSEELRYIFQMQSFLYDNTDLSKFPEGDIKVQHRLLKIWTDFAKTLNPTPTDAFWPLFNEDSLYVDINENLEVRNHPKNSTYKKWVQLYDSLGHDDFDTY